MPSISHLIVVAVATASVLAHPHPRSIEEVHAIENASRSLKACTRALSKRGHVSRGAERRMQWAEKVRKERSIAHSKPFVKRDLATALNTSHLSDFNGTPGLTQWVLPEYLFSSNSSCALEADPDVTEGPYFVAGEYVRSDLIDDDEGIPIWIDLEVVDVTTCTPVDAKYVEIWAANASGLYSGVTDGGDSNLNTTHGRGLQLTSEDGVVQFKTLFPGHYSGRTQHIHVAVFSNATSLPNGTVYSNQASHVGQMFFDEDLTLAVEKIEPYASHTSNTYNADDSILAQQASAIDPLLEYVYLGDSLSDGLLMWTQLGVDMSNIVNMNVAATHYVDGGVSNGNSMGGGGGEEGSSGPGGNGTAPGGGSMSMGGIPPATSTSA